MVYTSVDNNKIKEYHKLHSKKYRDITNTFLVEGEHLVIEALKNGVLKTVLKLDDFNLPFECNVEVINCNHKVMRFLSELDTASKVIGVCEKKQSVVKGSKLLVLDSLQDPGNLGTIIRSAQAFNVDTIILSENCVDLYNSKVIRASQGMIFSSNIVITELKQFLESLDGFTIYGTKVDGGTNLKDISNDGKCAIIMGNEGSGVRKEILDICDKYIYIKMNEKCESLNVAVATSIILYELDK